MCVTYIRTWRDEWKGGTLTNHATKVVRLLCLLRLLPFFPPSRSTHIHDIHQGENPTQNSGALDPQPCQLTLGHQDPFHLLRSRYPTIMSLLLLLLLLLLKLHLLLLLAVAEVCI